MVTLYTQPGCGPCAGAKRYLESQGVDHVLVDVTEDAEAAERLRRGGFTGTPVVGHAGRLHTVDKLRDVVAELKAA